MNALDRYGTRVAKSLGNPSDAPFAVGILIYFFICGFLIGYLWARLFLARSLTEAESRVRLQKRLNKLEQQAQADALAITLARRQLAADANQKPTVVDLERAIEAASDETRSHIFYQAENNRWKNWESNKERMERSAPIFGALAQTDPNEKYHRNLGQLGYSYKDQRDPNWAEADRLLTRAIKSRGDPSTSGWAAYEANRGICRIMLGSSFAQRFGSKKEADEAIIADLRVGASEFWVSQWLAKDSNVTKWLKENSLEFPD